MPLPTPDSVLATRGPAVSASALVEETEVADARAALSPSQQVEQRLVRLLANNPTFVSQMQRQQNRGAR